MGSRVETLRGSRRSESGRFWPLPCEWLACVCLVVGQKLFDLFVRLSWLELVAVRVRGGGRVLVWLCVGEQPRILSVRLRARHG